MQISLFTVAPGDSRALDDLSNFRREQYPKIKPALSRRYPRHEWR